MKRPLECGQAAQHFGLTSAQASGQLSKNSRQIGRLCGKTIYNLFGLQSFTTTLLYDENNRQEKSLCKKTNKPCNPYRNKQLCCNGTNQSVVEVHA